MKKWLIVLALICLTTCAMADVPQLETDEVNTLVEQLFYAAYGTTYESEKALREGMSEEEQSARNAENAQYREKTLPWLKAAFELTEPEETEEIAEEPQYTTADSYAAFAEREQGQAFLDALKPYGAEDEESALNATKEIVKQWLALIDTEKLTEQNRDYACWLYAPGTQIDYPVVHGEDNEYYLNHLFNGKKNSSGTLFIDYRNLSGFRDPNTLIYGHAMTNKSMFGSLIQYEEQAYFEGNPYVLVISDDQILLLEIFAGYTTTYRDHSYDLSLSDEKAMQEFIDKALEKSDFTTEVDVQTTDNVVTLATCSRAFKNARYVVITRVNTLWEAEK